jgi:pimeloyl-ACP methyl ester carboxylesterase
MPSVEMVALVAAAAALPVAIGIFVYVAGSFLLMRRHVVRRPLGRHVGEALREIGWAARTQPLLPLYYFVGRRLAGGRGTPIVAVHGYAQNRVDFVGLARACARAGLGPVYGFNYPWFATVDGNARRLARFCERVRAETGATQVDLVAHSLGGLVAMEYLHEGGAPGVRSLVTLASPHAGVTWEGPIVGACGPQLRAGGAFLARRADRAVPVPSLSVYSTHDNVVHPPTTSMLRARGGRDRVVDHVGHLSILFDASVARDVVDFLGGREGAAALALPARVSPGSCATPSRRCAR